uniref:Conserved oligomeric Golgi complex subunit 4 n=1 Tax=Panagrellus redivivus TaxID=6233 RepID=A0A7E4V961_PANRE
MPDAYGFRDTLTKDDFGYFMRGQTSPLRGPKEWRPKLISKPAVTTKSVPKAKVNDEKAKKLAEIEKEIAAVEHKLLTERDREDRLLNEIQSEISSSGLSEKDRITSFDRAVARLANHAETIGINASSLSTNLKSISVLAESISSRVAELDTAKSRVVECLQRVNDLRDLRTCSEGVEKAIKDEEFEEAAQYIHRFYTLEGVVFKMGSKFDSSDQNQSMKHSYDVLRKASETLREIAEKNFDAAVASGDTGSMVRFFKIFPLLNQHANGLQRFGAYLCRKIEKSCADHLKIMEAGGTEDARRNVLYSDTMTTVLEDIAREVVEYQPLIDNFYGPDKLLNLMEIIQIECDKQTTKVLDAFIKARQYEQKARQVRDYLRGSSNAANETKLDPIALDVLLSEVTILHTRSELYWRFLRRRLGEAPARPLSEGDDSQAPRSPTFAQADFDEDDELTDEQRTELQERQKKAKAERAKKLDAVLNRSQLGTRMQEILGKYVMMEQYYMQECVIRALESETVEEGSLTTSVLDDVFFIVRKSIRRSITSSSVDCVCAMINNGMTLLETEYLEALNSAIRAGYPSTGWTAEAYQHAQTAYNVLQHGRTVAEAGPETQKRVFLAALNNLRASQQSVTTLSNGLRDDFDHHLKQISATEKTKLDHSLTQFEELARKFEQTTAIAIGKLCHAAFRAKLKTAAEAYTAYSHELTDDEFTTFEAIDPFIDEFISQLDTNVHRFEELLVPENYEALLESVAAEAANQVERVVLKCSFNQLGGIQLDKEIRSLSSYLTTVVGWRVREKTAKLSQIANLLSCDSVEDGVNFFRQLQTSTSALSLNDLKTVLALRADLPKDTIKAIKM